MAIYYCTYEALAMRWIFSLAHLTGTEVPPSRFHFQRTAF